MLTLNEILTAVEQLSPQEREQVRQHIEELQPQTIQRRRNTTSKKSWIPSRKR